MARKFIPAKVAQAYEEHPLRQSTILARIQKQKGNLTGVTELDLAVDDETEITDQNHIGGLAFLQGLARKAEVNSGSIVLDAGCGLGGSSRALAHLYGCRVHGVELTEQRYRDAVALTELVGLENLVSFTRGDFLSADIPPGKFHIILAQSSFAHFIDKRHLVARCADLLMESGLLAFEEGYLKRSAYAEDEKLQLDELEEVWNSHISSLDEWLSCLSASRFRVVVNEDLTDVFQDYYSKLMRIFEKAPSGSFAVDEVKGWKHALALAREGIIGYIRIVASLQSS